MQRWQRNTWYMSGQGLGQPQPVTLSTNCDWKTTSVENVDLMLFLPPAVRLEVTSNEVHTWCTKHANYLIEPMNRSQNYNHLSMDGKKTSEHCFPQNTSIRCH